MGEEIVIEWAGDVDLSNAVPLRVELERAVAGANSKPLTIDMARVGFVDSIGLGVLVQARNATLEAGTTIMLRSVPRILRRLLTVSGLSELFEFDDPHPTCPVDLHSLPDKVFEKATADGQFDRVAVLVSRLLDVPTALVSLVDQEGQVFPGAVGLPQPWQDERRTPLSHSFCQYVVARAAPLVVCDARTDPLLSDNAAVDDLNVVAYAGIPLTDDTGRVVGSLCAIDSRPRQWSETELDNLRDLAAICSAEVTFRSASRKATLAAERERFVRGVQDDVVGHLLKLGTLLSGVQAISSTHSDALLHARVAEAVTESELALTTLRATVFDVRRHDQIRTS